MNHYIQNPMVEIGGNWWKLVEIGGNWFSWFLPYYGILLYDYPLT